MSQLLRRGEISPAFFPVEGKVGALLLWTSEAVEQAAQVVLLFA